MFLDDNNDDHYDNSTDYNNMLFCRERISAQDGFDKCSDFVNADDVKYCFPFKKM